MIKTYQGDIILRMFKGDKEKMQQFHEDYEEVKFIRSEREITPLDLKIVAEWKKMFTVRELSQKFKLSQSQIESRIRTVAKNKLRNS